MYSNFITPPDFVEDKKHTVTVVDASTEEVEVLGRMAQISDEDFNVYLYKNDMNDLSWLQRAIELSDAVIVNTNVLDNANLCTSNQFYYYGEQSLLSPAHRITSPLDYFVLRKENN